MARKRTLILGAGLAGLSAAWHLQRRGVECLVFEKEPEVGGLCRSKEIKGFTFDFDGHLLHFKHNYTLNLVKRLLGSNLAEHRRNAWIYSHGGFCRYPFQANLHGLPKSVVQDCLLGLIDVSNNGHKKVKGNPSFQDWIDYTFGRGIAKHFMVPYNTKFWTIPPRELTCEWLDGFIPVPSLSQIVEGAIDESRRQFGYNARFWYPRKGGINHLPSAFASEIAHINTDCKVSGIDLVRKEIRLASGSKERFDFLISTLPLPELPNLIENIPQGVLRLFRKLRWNSILNLNLGIAGRDPFQGHWIYFPQKEIRFFRTGFFHNFSSNLAPPGKSSLYVELAYSREKPINKEKSVSASVKDLKKLGIIIREKDILVEDINDIKYGYPVYDYSYAQAREGIIEYLSGNNIICCGRYGGWRYMSMEGVILDGQGAAGRIVSII